MDVTTRATCAYFRTMPRWNRSKDGRDLWILDMENPQMRPINRAVVLAAGAALVITIAGPVKAGWRFEENGPYPIAKGQEQRIARAQSTSSGSGADYARRCETSKPFKCHPERS